MKLGDSIAVNGVCLTAVALNGAEFAADVSRETLALTTLGGLKPGSPVNLEKALTLATPLGGHLVSGHVDGMGEILARHDDGRSWRLRIAAPAELAKLHRPQGVDLCGWDQPNGQCRQWPRVGVEHSPAYPRGDHHRRLCPGTRVNLEVDLIARYLERLLLGEKAAEPQAQGKAGSIDEAFLARNGFL